MARSIPEMFAAWRQRHEMQDMNYPSRYIKNMQRLKILGPYVLDREAVIDRLAAARDGADVTE